MTRPFSELEQNIGYVFKNKKLLEKAMTHTSYANEHKMKKDAKKAQKSVKKRLTNWIRCCIRPKLCETASGICLCSSVGRAAD